MRTDNDHHTVLSLFYGRTRAGGEWKIRYDAQLKHNTGLMEEVGHLQDQIAQSEDKYKEGKRSSPALELLQCEILDPQIRLVHVWLI